MAAPIIDSAIPAEPGDAPTGDARSQDSTTSDLSAAIAAPAAMPMPASPVPALWDNEDGWPALGDAEDDADGPFGGVVHLWRNTAGRTLLGRRVQHQRSPHNRIATPVVASRRAPVAGVNYAA